MKAINKTVRLYKKDMERLKDIRRSLTGKNSEAEAVRQSIEYYHINNILNK